MSHTSVSPKNKNLLWALSGGRCEFEGCNKILYRDILTNKKYNAAYVAHIVADSPRGPRGDKELSKKLRDDIANLMLLCDAHHRLIDSSEGVVQYPRHRLLTMKRNHEDRIERVTDIDVNKSSEIILYGANIGEHNCPLSYEVACEAMNFEYYPASNHPIELSLKNSLSQDRDELYWSTEEYNLVAQFNQKVKPRLMSCNTDHYSLLALAPQPLLIKLGTLYNDLHSVRVYQKHREPSTWKWQTATTKIEYKLVEPKDKTKQPALIFSLSADINYERIEKVIGKTTSIWEITIDSPNNDFLKTEKLLSDFRSITRYALNKIKLHHGRADLNIFPAMPVSASIELGRVWMPKADMPLIIYDENREKDGFHKTLTIK